MSSILLFLIIVFLLIGITTTCDFTPYTLTDAEIQLIYNDGKEQDATDNGSSIFGNSTVTKTVNENDILSESAKDQAEELLEQIYNSR